MNPLCDLIGPPDPRQGVGPYRPGLRTPACEPDTQNWRMVIAGADLVQAMCPCLCGDEVCGWIAAVYASGWYQ